MLEGEKLRKWIEAAGETQEAFALRAGLSRTLLSYAMGNKRPTTRANADAIERATSGEISADALVEQYENAKISKRAHVEEEPAPASGPRTLVDEPLAPGQTLEKLRRSAARTERLLRNPQLSASHAAALEGRHQAALVAIQKIELEGALENHPDFPGVLDLVLMALERTLRQLGVNPDGARSVFAGHLEAAEAEQLQRRAA